jgi:glyoxylase-like metal-dependent hydrolase (beta-lactamase superfamily II)
MKLIAIEGNTQRLDGGAMFGNVPKELWMQWISPDEKNRIPLATRALLIQTDDGRNVLCDTGIGAFFEPKLQERYGVQETEHMLLKNLEALGLKENDIDVVILSHLHFDHAGGLLTPYGQGEPRLLFPKAKYYVGNEHWNRARQPHIRERVSFVPLIHELLEDSKRLVFIENQNHRDLNFGINFRYSQGHTIGLLIMEILHPEAPVFMVNDLIPGLPWVHLPVTMGYDRYPEFLVDEKKQLLKEMIQRKGILFFTHDPHTAWATVSCDENGRYTASPLKKDDAF